MLAVFPSVTSLQKQIGIQTWKGLHIPPAFQTDKVGTTHQKQLVCSGTREYCATRTDKTINQIMPQSGWTQTIQIWSAHAILPQQQLFVPQAASSQMKSPQLRQTWQGQSRCWQVQLTCEPCWCSAGPSSSESASQQL